MCRTKAINPFEAFYRTQGTDHHFICASLFTQGVVQCLKLTCSADLTILCSNKLCAIRWLDAIKCALDIPHSKSA